MTYQQGAISVDRDFARFGERSFAIGQITSIEVREHVPPRGSGVASFVCAVALLLCWFLALGGGGWLMFLVGGAFGYGAYALFPSDALPTWRLFVTTSAGQAQAFEAVDKGDVLELREAIEAAMAARGGP